MFSKAFFAVILVIAMFALMSEAYRGGGGKYIFTFSFLTIEIEIIFYIGYRNGRFGRRGYGFRGGYGGGFGFGYGDAFYGGFGFGIGAAYVLPVVAAVPVVTTAIVVG
jgi:hypothetical protein